MAKYIFYLISVTRVTYLKGITYHITFISLGEFKYLFECKQPLYNYLELDIDSQEHLLEILSTCTALSRYKNIFDIQNSFRYALIFPRIRFVMIIAPKGST